MIDQESLTSIVIETTQEVFSTMLDMRVQCLGPAEDAPSSEAGLIALVGITGDWTGSGFFGCSPRMAATIYGRMLGECPHSDPGVVNEEILDITAEMSNMLIGNMKNAIARLVGPLAISIPTVIHGRNFRLRNGSGLRGVSLMFEAEADRFEIRIALSPAPEKPSVRLRASVLDLATV